MKFLHCADLHLGGAEPQERMKALWRMLDFCAKNGVQLLLIAGDLFESAQVPRRVRQEVFAAFAQRQELSVVIAAGNHDPLCRGGCYDEELPENVYVFGAEWSCVEIAELGVRVWGASFTEEKAPAFRPQRHVRQEGILELGVLHGDLVSENAGSDYRAVTQSAIAAAGPEYLALGHIHQRSRVQRAGQTCYAYSGCLQGAGFDEVGEKGAYLGQWNEGRLEMAFVRLCGSMCIECGLEVTGVDTLQQVVNAYEERIGLQKQHRVKLTLTGQSRQAWDTAALERLLQDYALQIRIADETRKAADEDAIAGENTLRGAFVRRMLQKIAALENAGRDAATERLALQYGLEAFEGEVGTDAHRADSH